MLNVLTIAGIECEHFGTPRRAPANRLRPSATIYSYMGRTTKDKLLIEITAVDNITYGFTGHYYIHDTPLVNEINKSYVKGVSIQECISDLSDSIDCFRKAEELKQRLGVI